MRAAQYDGFWAPMDTLKERTALEEQYRRGISPWALWRRPPRTLSTTRRPPPRGFVHRRRTPDPSTAYPAEARDGSPTREGSPVG